MLYRNKIYGTAKAIFANFWLSDQTKYAAAIAEIRISHAYTDPPSVNASSKVTEPNPRIEINGKNVAAINAIAAHSAIFLFLDMSID